MAKFFEGCMWEGGDWEIESEYLMSTYEGDKKTRPCRHSVVIGPEHPRWDKEEAKTYSERHIKCHHKNIQWLVPHVVIATNEGGHNSTGVCLDCILEASTTLGKSNKPDKIDPGVYVYSQSIILVQENGSVFSVLGKNDFIGNVAKLDKELIGAKLDVVYDP